MKKSGSATMIEVDQVLVSDDLIREEFVCNLSACRGACCIEGDAGAPLLRYEQTMLEEIYPQVAPYMTDVGIATIEEEGVAVRDPDGDLTTPCVDGDKECAYVNWDNGIAKCAIEKAYEHGDVAWQKPISCHLYPIRITEFPDFDILHYDRWHICNAACTLGKQLKVPVYQFLKTPLIRKYGEKWYDKLEKIAANYPHA